MVENKNIIGACGDNCYYCLRYKATVNQDIQELKRIKDLWVSLGLRDSTVSYKELECSGCQKENKCAYKEVRNCVFLKKLNNCGECKIYPCGLISEAFDRTEKLFNNSVFNCSNEDRIALENSFYKKKINLDKIHNELFNKKT